MVKNIFPLLLIAALTGCGGSMKLAVPAAFKEQASMVHINGARGNRMSFDNFNSSKIKRGIHLIYPGWGRGFFLENLLLHQAGIQKDEIVRKEKAKFRYQLSDGQQSLDIYGDEKQVTKSLQYTLLPPLDGILKNYRRVQLHQYIFSAQLGRTGSENFKTWELVMTNLYDRKKENDRRLITVLRPDDSGLATNGTDTIFIKALSLKETALSNGKESKLPFAILSGYELSGPGGVIAIIDLIDHNLWLYNELDSTERLIISGITTAIFARKVNDTKW